MLRSLAAAIAAGNLRPARIAVAVGAMALGGVIGAISAPDRLLPPLGGPNGLLYDLTAAVLADRDHANGWRETATILIDKASLDSAPLSSVPRALFHPYLADVAARALELGAHKVGFDLVVALDPANVSLSGASLGQHDATFRNLLESFGDRVVLGAYPAFMPAKPYAEQVGPFGVGVVDLQEEADGTVRSIATRLLLPSGDIALGFAHLLSVAPDAEQSVPNEPRRLLFPRAPLTAAPTYSFARFIACAQTEAGRAALTSVIGNRRVLVGTGIFGEDIKRAADTFMRAPVRTIDAARAASATAPGLDCAPRPPPKLASYGNDVPGVLVQAAAVESALDPTTPVFGTTGDRVSANAGFAALSLFAFALVSRRINRWPAHRPRLFSTSMRAFGLVALALAGLCGTALVLEIVFVKAAGLWLPLGHGLVAMSTLGLFGIMTIAVRRDLALADLRSAFGRYLPKPVVEAALAPVAGNPFAGEERAITVLTADLSGFTAYCGKFREHPAEIIGALTRKFSAAQQALDLFDGCLDKYIGDALLAFWNGVGEQPDHAARAVACGLAILEAEAVLARDGTVDPLVFKVAIATGEAFVGSYGSPQKVNFSAIGEPMNLAARLEKVAGDHSLKFVMSEATHAALLAQPSDLPAAQTLLARYFFERVGEVEVKGFAAPVGFWAARLREGDGVRI